MTRILSARNLLALVILILAGTLAVTVVRNFHWADPAEIVDSLPGNVDLSMKKVNYTETRNGIRRWTLAADSANQSMGQGLARIENIRMTFFDENGAEKATLTARSGELNTATHEVETRGDVVIKNTKGVALYTERLCYREGERLISGTDPVKLVFPTMEITGKGFHFHLQDNSFQVLSDVHARIEGTVNG
jgi:LPS export ABC transporter protein LptC